MPQPISRVVQSPKIYIADDALADKPDMAILVTKIFAVWAKIEYQLGVLLVHVLRAVESPAIAMFSVLTAQHLQLRALDAAAKSALSKEDYEVFQAVVSICDIAQKSRNRLAHWVWCICTQRPDLLCLANPAMLRARDVSATKFQIDHLEKPIDWEGEAARNLYRFDPEHVLAYSVADLESALSDLVEAENALFQFEFYLEPRFLRSALADAGLHDDPEALRAETLQGLNEGRLFREALARIRENQKSTSSPPNEAHTPKSP